jgi:LacI family transcriptional regulator
MNQLNHLPHIFVSATPDLPTESYVDSDGKAGAAAAVKHLLDQGHTRIGYLMPSDGHDQFNALDRLQGAQDEMERAGLQLSVYYASHWEETISLDAMLTDKVTAIIAWNDIFALRVISKLSRLGSHVPQDIAVIGFDDEMFSKWTYPKITTVSQPIADMSKAAIDYLITRIKTKEKKILRQKFPVQLVVRDSG